MNTIIYNKVKWLCAAFFTLHSSLFTFTSCATDIEQPVLQGFDNVAPRQLTATATNVVLDKTNETGAAMTLNWGEFNLSVSDGAYGVPEESIATYVELSHTASFAKVDTALLAKDDNVSFTKQYTFTNDQLNIVLSKLGYVRDVAADVFLRIRYEVGINKAPQYSSVLKATVTPYGIIFDRMQLFAKDDFDNPKKRKSVGMLYSPDETGVYQGYVAGTDWMNFFLMERDETFYGSQPGSAFKLLKLTDDLEVGEDVYNCWLPSTAGSYRLTADVNEMTWTSEEIGSMKLISTSGKQKPMTFNLKTNSWSGVISTTAAGETMSAKASAWMKTNDDENGKAVEIDLASLLTINEVGKWLVTIDLNGVTPAARYGATDQAEEADPDPMPAGIPQALLIIADNNEKTTLSRLYSTNNDGTFTGFYVTSAGSEKFYLTNDAKTTTWGVGSTGQYSIVKDGGNLSTTDAVGLRRVDVDLTKNTWSEMVISRINVTGTYNSWQTDKDPLTYDAATRKWSADINVTTIGDGLKLMFNGQWNEYLALKDGGVLKHTVWDENYKPAATGKYRLTIDINDYEHMTYELTKID